MILKVNSSLRDYILKKYDQIDIFAHYLNVTTDDISMCIYNRNKKINNTLRVDNKPSVGFRYNNNNKLIMRDFANSFYTGDCFYIAGIALGLNCNNPTHFIEICKNIDAHVNKEGVKNNKLIVFNHTPQNTIIADNTFDITYREVNKYDINYFSKFDITKEQIIKYFTPAETAINTVNDYIVEHYLYDRKDPCYVIKLGIINRIPRYKLYFPNRRTGKKPRFRTNYTLNLEDIPSLKTNKNLIIQKSLKDEITLGNFLKEFNVINTDIIRISSESIVLNQQEINVIKCRYPNVYTMFDNDSQGNVAANIHREKYNITPIYMVDLLKIAFPEMKSIIEQDIYSPHIPKNFSDFREMYDRDKTLILTQTLIKHYL